MANLDVMVSGLNINHNVGATHPQALVAAVQAHQADYGVALDGVAARYADTMLALPALQAWYADARAESEVIAQAEPYRQG